MESFLLIKKVMEWIEMDSEEFDSYVEERSQELSLRFETAEREDLERENFNKDNVEKENASEEIEDVLRKREPVQKLPWRRSEQAKNKKPALNNKN